MPASSIIGHPTTKGLAKQYCVVCALFMTDFLPFPPPRPSPSVCANDEYANQTCTGLVLTDVAQMEILYKAQSAYFVSVVMCQIATAHVCKFRKGLPWGSRFLM